MSKSTPKTPPTPQALVRLEGQIERIAYVSSETGYTVVRLQVVGRDDLVTAVGVFMSPSPGEQVQLQGEWRQHPQYGQQFKVHHYQIQAPVTLAGIEKYLGSGVVRGIGPKMAQRIVRRFGPQTLEVIRNEPQRLSTVAGIGSQRIKQIQNTWEKKQALHDVMVFLESHGLGSSMATKVLKQYGNAAVQILQSNPYQLAIDITGVGFKIADGIARTFGISKTDPHRVGAGILFEMQASVSKGHVYYPLEPLKERARTLLGVDGKVLTEALHRLAEKKQIVIEEMPIQGKALRLTAEPHKAVYLPPYHASETGISQRLKSLVANPTQFAEIDTHEAIAWVQTKLALKLAARQIDAIRAAVVHKILVITGGPGTGKTTLIQAVTKIFKSLNATLLLAAPTGRAAKRLSEATGQEARTLHRLLEYSPKADGFKKNEHRPLDCEALVVDEASMVDTVLMHHLLKAVPLHATLILVGDIHQLPSVGAGNVLRDVIDANRFPVITLKEIFRQARASRIVTNAHRVNFGQMPDLRPRGPRDDFFFIPREDPQAALETILKLVTQRIPQGFGYDPKTDIQVLTPMHKGVAGAINLNRELQAALNPDAPEMLRGTSRLRVADKVMQIRNNYEKDVFNGDIGTIFSIDAVRREITVQFEDQRVIYAHSDLDEIELAYAVSIHKSQGSEYPVVIVPILTQHYVLLQRNLIYTAMTRGRQLVVVVGSARALHMALQRNQTDQRYSGLVWRIQRGI